jgi:DNA-binding transcriptional LysR family regulator
VAEEQQFSRAAKRANIVQSGLSAAVKALEEELGALLFIRTTRRVELTPTGRIFLPEARRVLEAVRAAKASVAGVGEGLTGRLAVGTIESLTPFLDLPELLQRFNAEHPKVKLVVQEANLSSLVGGLRDGSLDLVFMLAQNPIPAGLVCDRLFRSRMVVVHAPDHELAGQKSVELTDLRHEQFIDFSPRWGTRHLVDQMFASVGAERSVNYEVESYDLMYQFVLRGLGLGLMPEAMTRLLRLPTLDLSTRKGGYNPAWELGLFYPATSGQLSANPAADRFRELVYREAPPLSPTETPIP